MQGAMASLASQSAWSEGQGWSRQQVKAGADGSSQVFLVERAERRTDKPRGTRRVTHTHVHHVWVNASPAALSGRTTPKDRSANKSMQAGGRIKDNG